MSTTSNNRGLPPRPPTPKTTATSSSYQSNKLDDGYLRGTSASTPSTPNFTSFHPNHADHISSFDVKSKPLMSPSSKSSKVHNPAASSSVRSQSAIRTTSDNTYESPASYSRMNDPHDHSFTSSHNNLNNTSDNNNNNVGLDDDQQQQQQQDQDQDDLESMDSNDPTHNTMLYKTELCRSYQESGFCRYGVKCRFAHGDVDLRPVLRHKKYKTERCKNFEKSGYCPYGHRCRFIHNEHDSDAMNTTSISINDDDAQSIASTILHAQQQQQQQQQQHNNNNSGSPLLASLGFPNNNVEPALSLSERLSTSSGIDKSVFLHNSPAPTHTTQHNNGGGRNLFDQSVSVSVSGHNNGGFDMGGYSNFHQPFLPPAGSMGVLGGAFHSSHSSPFVEPIHHDSMSIDNNLLDNQIRTLSLAGGSERGSISGLHNDYPFLPHDLGFDDTGRMSHTNNSVISNGFDNLSNTNGNNGFLSNNGNNGGINNSRGIPGHAKPPLPNYNRNNVGNNNNNGGYMQHSTPTSRGFMDTFMSNSTPSSRHESPLISSIPMNGVDLFRSDSDNAVKSNAYPLFRRTNSQDTEQPMLMNVKSAHTLQSDLNLNLADSFISSNPQ